MASVELGGFEVRSENESVYVTDNFFSMLGKKELSEKSMTGKDFMEFWIPIIKAAITRLEEMVPEFTV